MPIAKVKAAVIVAATAAIAAGIVIIETVKAAAIAAGIVIIEAVIAAAVVAIVTNSSSSESNSTINIFF